MSPGPDPAVELDGYDEFVEVGRGGSSTVYSARQIGLDRLVAVKVLQTPMDDEPTRRRFGRECAALGAIGELPGVVDVYTTAFTNDGRGCIVMRLMKESLADELARSGPLSPVRVREIGVVCATALQRAHDQGIVHRDVKPANLLVSENGEVALADFDVAWVEQLVATDTVEALTPPHAAPERLGTLGEAGPSADIWALGSTLFTLLDGQPPFGSAASVGGIAGLVDRIRNDAPRALLPVVADRQLGDVLLRALEKRPVDRWSTAAAFATALDQLDIVDPPEPRAFDGDRPGPRSELRGTGEVTVDPAAYSSKLRAAAQVEGVDGPVPHPSGGRARSAAAVGFVALVVAASMLAAVLLALR